MSRDYRDKRGGHDVRRSGTYSCGCCDVLVPGHESRNRTQRERESARRESDANEAGHDDDC